MVPWLYSPDEGNVVVGHILDHRETASRAEVLVTDGPHLVWHVDTETHEGSGHTGNILDDEHARMDTSLLDGEELDQEVVVRVFGGHNLPLILTHNIKNDVAQLANGWPIETVSQKQ